MANVKVARADTGAKMKINGTVETITFRNEENGYAVLKVIGEKTGTRAALVGVLPECFVGQDFLATGCWITRPN